MPRWLVNLLWFIGVVVSLAVVFGIAAPFVWIPVFGSSPSENMVAMSSMLTILLAILALGVAFGGLTVYNILERHIENRANEVKADFESKASELTRQQQVIAEEAAARHRARLLVSEGYNLWTIYGNLRQMPNQTLATLVGLLSKAIERCVLASSVIEQTTARPEDELFACELKNNWGYYLAERSLPEDRELAREHMEFLKARIGNYPAYTVMWPDTINHVLTRYP
jgi:hypothetical protein